VTRARGAPALWPGRILCRQLERLGVEHVFGLPGTGNLTLFDELRRSRIRVVAPAHELSASFMANGYYRASGRPGVVAAVAGPGLAFAVPGLAEARLDSAAVLCITGARPGQETVGRRFQEIPQRSLLAPIVKACFRIRTGDQMGEVAARALETAAGGEPGPVLLEIEDDAWSGAAPDRPPGARASQGHAGPAAALVLDRLKAARLPIFLVGQGAQGGGAELRRMAEALGAPVLASTSGRGALPEDHPLSFALDRLPAGVGTAREMVDAADLVVVLGCGLSHNATWGFRLEIPSDKLLRVDAAMDERARERYAASDSIEADVPALLDALVGLIQEGRAGISEASWTDEHLEAWRGDRDGGSEGLPDPIFPGDLEPREFFSRLREALPRETIVVTDSGHHEMMLRRHFTVLSPRGLVAPSDFQAMGFGVPASVGAALACPDRPVVAVVGDGGLRATGMEMATAARAGASVVVLALADGHFGLIRRQQLEQFGHSEATRLPHFELESFAASVGAEYRRIDGDPAPAVGLALEEGGVHLLEVRLEDASGVRRQALRQRAREGLREALGPRGITLLKRLRGSFRARDAGE